MSLYTRSEKAEKWSQSLIDSFFQNTGKSIDQWIEIAKTCPETAPRKQLAWFKQEHGLLQNRAIHVLSIVFPQIHDLGFDNPESLVDALFLKFPNEKETYLHVLHYVLDTYHSVVASPRKTFVALVAKKNLALLLLNKEGLIISFILPESTKPIGKLILSKKPFAGGERNKHHIVLQSITDFDDEVKSIINLAFEFNK
jgi:hypothetical protein